MDNIYSISSVFLLKRGDASVMPGVANKLFSHPDEVSQGDFYGLVNSLLKKYDGNIVKISDDLVDRHGFSVITPIGVSYSLPTLGESDLESTLGLSL